MKGFPMTINFKARATALSTRKYFGRTTQEEISQAYYDLCGGIVSGERQIKKLEERIARGEQTRKQEPEL